jgi:hypothetical protein
MVIGHLKHARRRPDTKFRFSYGGRIPGSGSATTNQQPGHVPGPRLRPGWMICRHETANPQAGVLTRPNVPSQFFICFFHLFLWICFLRFSKGEIFLSSVF